MDTLFLFLLMAIGMFVLNSLLSWNDSMESDKLRKENTELYRQLNFSRVKSGKLENDIYYLKKKAGAMEGVNGQNSYEFTKEDIKKLLILCHPDKHEGKNIATEITTKLNKLKIFH